MPIVSVQRDLLFQSLERTYTEDEFRQLCFDFGIELDDVTSEKAIAARMFGTKADLDKLSGDIIYKIDIPANRYDLLCLEGLSRAIRVFLDIQEAPLFSVADVPDELIPTMTVSSDLSSLRPFVVAAIIRDVAFTSASFQSFIDLQEKLHSNICRDRRLVAIGTHDLDAIEGPFSYEAIAPEQISFRALKQDTDMNARELFAHYHAMPQCPVRKYLPLIDSSPVLPVIYDSNRNVLSLPPIINSEHSKMSASTRNIFIECTATDLTKAHIVLNTMVCMFAQYSRGENCMKVHPVRIVYPDGSEMVTPQLQSMRLDVSAASINAGIGIDLSASEMVRLLRRMQITASELPDGIVHCEIPPTRSDILHACDIVEDVAIAFGFNNIQKRLPSCYTMARQQPIGLLSDLLRESVAQAGYTEVLTWALVSKEDNYINMCTTLPENGGVTVGNPKTLEFEMIRTSLLPGILKTLSHNRAVVNLPIRLFELGDVVLLDSSTAIGARNERRLGAVFCARSAGFDVIHGLLDRVMEVNNVVQEDVNENRVGTGRPPIGSYHICASSNTSFLPNLRADVMYRPAGSTNEHISIGSFGVLHPEVLENFDIDSPCSALELTIQTFLNTPAEA